jgi:hypothetical protein
MNIADLNIRKSGYLERMNQWGSWSLLTPRRKEVFSIMKRRQILLQIEQIEEKKVQLELQKKFLQSLISSKEDMKEKRVEYMACRD